MHDIWDEQYPQVGKVKRVVPPQSKMLDMVVGYPLYKQVLESE